MRKFTAAIAGCGNYKPGANELDWGIAIMEGDGLTTLFSSDVPVGRRGPVEKLLRHTVAVDTQRDEQARRDTYAGLLALEGKLERDDYIPNLAYANALAVAAERLIQSARKLLKLLVGAQA